MVRRHVELETMNNNPDIYTSGGYFAPAPTITSCPERPATTGSGSPSSDWLGELEAALLHVKKAKDACRKRGAWADWNDCARTEKDLEYIIETQRHRSASASLELKTI